VAVIDSVKFAIFNLENLILDLNSTAKTIRNLFLFEPKIILNFDSDFRFEFSDLRNLKILKDNQIVTVITCFFQDAPIGAMKQKWHEFVWPL